ncbi:uncharacterized protein LOC143281494 [Babylonia areolata]|uniref:uncharacterized protein LOC143281494 n=1 Tax=Babylonia areolata TaxID=304850 RepID=UPI003FD2B624
MWTAKPGQSAALDYYIDQCKHEIAQANPKPLRRSNISHSEQQALMELKQRKDIVIKQADKGGALVVWRKDLYEEEALKQLSNTAHYTPMSRSSTKSDNALVRRTVKEVISKGHLPPEATRAITKEPQESRFYMLPKIHKPDNSGRPIVSACACPTVQLSAFLDRLFQPLVEKLPTYIKDTNRTLELFHKFRFPNQLEPPLLFTMDITSLYTNIPHKDGLIALKHLLSNSPYNVHVPTILRLAELVLTLNSFQFGDSHYQQTSGVAMGTRMGPSYACLLVGYVESQIFQQYSGPMPALFSLVHQRLCGPVDR